MAGATGGGRFQRTEDPSDEIARLRAELDQERARREEAELLARSLFAQTLPPVAVRPPRRRRRLRRLLRRR